MKVQMRNRLLCEQGCFMGHTHGLPSLGVCIILLALCHALYADENENNPKLALKALHIVVSKPPMT